MLARTMGRTLSELGETMSSEEFSQHWMDYQESPWGEFRVDLAAATVCATLANIHRTRDASPFSASDFMPRFVLDDIGQDEEEVGSPSPLSSAAGLFAAMNAAFDAREGR